MKTKKYTNYKRTEIMDYEHPQIQRFIDKWGFNYLSNIRQVSLNGNTRRKDTSFFQKTETPSFSLTPADSYSHREAKQTISNGLVFTSISSPCESSLDEMFIGGMR